MKEREDSKAANGIVVSYPVRKLAKKSKGRGLLEEGRVPREGQKALRTLRRKPEGKGRESEAEDRKTEGRKAERKNQSESREEEA